MKSGRRAWLGQRASDVAAKGKKLAPWIVFWNCPDTGKRREKSCGAGKAGWRLAKSEADRLHVAIVSDTYAESAGRKTESWESFWKDYERDAMPRISLAAREATRHCINHFVRIVSPKTLGKITTRMIDQYSAQRRSEKRGEKLVSPATVNKELRHIRVVLRRAHRWGLLRIVPEFTFERETHRDPTYCKAEDFAAIYNHCDAASEPAGRPYSAGDWWRALLTTLYMTGWRIGETLALKRADVDLDTGIAKLHAETTKGKRDATIKLHPVIVEHLKLIRGFGDHVFEWRQNRRRLYVELQAIEKAAGLADYPYGFHDLRRAFATMNAANLSAPALQAMMRHRDYATTQKYINMAKQLDSTPIDVLYVPDVLKAKVTAG